MCKLPTGLLWRLLTLEQEINLKAVPLSAASSPRPKSSKVSWWQPRVRLQALQAQ